VILVSRDAMTASSPVAVVVPVVNHADWPNVSPGDVVLRAGGADCRRNR
jgi:mRNA-degrading endonuclease toxin of MazEF toxin-antitoxin module